MKRFIKMEKKATKTISYRIQFIDSTRCMTSSLSDHVDNLVEGSHKIRFKYGHDNKKCETCGTKYKDCNCCPHY